MSGSQQPLKAGPENFTRSSNLNFGSGKNNNNDVKQNQLKSDSCT